MRDHKKLTGAGSCPFIILMVLLMAATTFGQWTNYERLTRGRMWIDLHSFPGPDYQLSGDVFHRFDYPGMPYNQTYLREFKSAGFRMGFMVHANVDGVPTAYRCESVKGAGQPFDASGLILLEPVSKTKNYNLALGNGLAEEIVQAKLGLTYYGLEVHWKAMAWSFPKYDDFVILEFTIVNPAGNTKAITDFRWAYTCEWNIYYPQAKGIQYHLPRQRQTDDDLFEWDPARELFYWHDANQVVNQDIATPFVWSFGLTKHDLGEPADLYDQKAIEHDFRPPHYVTLALLG